MIEAKVRPQYRGLSRRGLLDKAYELGFNFEKNSTSCSQSTVAAIHEIFDMDDVVVRVMTSSCGGQNSQLLGTCGGLVGGTVALDYYFGRPAEKISYKEFIQSNIDAISVSKEVTALLFNEYIKEYGTIICSHIQTRLFGRFYYIKDEDEFEKFEAAGAHSAPDKCCHIVGNAARWVMEILLDRGAVKL